QRNGGEHEERRRAPEDGAEQQAGEREPGRDGDGDVAARSPSGRRRRLFGGLVGRRRLHGGASDLAQLVLFALEHLVDLADEAVGELLELLLRALAVVLGDLAALDVAVDLLLGVTANVSNRDAPVLGAFTNELDELLAALLGQLREAQPDDRTVVGRVEP